MAEEQNVSAAFPKAGLDVTSEFGRQPEDTTPDAANVVSFDVPSMRARGGSRPGLSKYSPEAVNGVHEIQHLTVLVDPQQPALLTDHGSDTIPDPTSNNLSSRNPGRQIRRGGSGVVPNRNSATSSGITVIYSGSSSDSVITGVLAPVDIAFSSSGVRGDDTIIAFTMIYDAGGGTPASPAVSSGAGTPYTKIGSDQSFSRTGFSGTSNVIFTAWRLRLTGGPGDNIVRMTPDSPVADGRIYMVAAAVIRGVRSSLGISTPTSSAVSGSDSDPGFASFDLGSITADTLGSVFVAGFATPDDSTGTAINGFSILPSTQAVYLSIISRTSDPSGTTPGIQNNSFGGKFFAAAGTSVYLRP